MSWFLNFAGKITKTDDWDFYFLRLDDKLASIFVDMGRKAHAPVPGFSLLCTLHLTMQNPQADGLSSQDEYETLSHIEDTLEKHIGNKAVYVGRITTDGRRDLVFYTKDFNSFSKAVNAAMKAFATYAYEVNRRHDKKWSIYKDFLYPSRNNRQGMMNRRVLESLETHGDDLTIPRKLDHRAYFKTPTDAEAFTTGIKALGFAIETSNHQQGEAGIYVDFCRPDAPEHINDVTAEILSLVAVHNGEYDGWGCEVTKA